MNKKPNWHVLSGKDRFYFYASGTHEKNLKVLGQPILMASNGGFVAVHLDGVFPQGVRLTTDTRHGL